MGQFGWLGKQYPLANVEVASTTKERILLEATIMFARQGFAAVSMRDIAKKVDIKAASIYNHFESKEALWEVIMEHVKALYQVYFTRLDAAIHRAGNFTEVLNCMFVELREIINIYTYYGFALVQAEQLRDKKAYAIYRDIFLDYSIQFIQDRFDICIEKGWAKPFNTRTVSTMFMSSVLININLRTHEDAGDSLPYDVSQMLSDIEALLLNLYQHSAKG